MGLRFAAFSNANRGNSPNKDTLTFSYITHANGRINSEGGIQDLIVQSTIEAELLAAASTLKEAAFCKSRMQALAFKD